MTLLHCSDDCCTAVSKLSPSRRVNLIVDQEGVMAVVACSLAAAVGGFITLAAMGQHGWFLAVVLAPFGGSAIVLMSATLFALLPAARMRSARRSNADVPRGVVWC